MVSSWDEPGYPQRHHDAVRSASYVSLGLFLVTGGVFAALLWGACYWRVPPFWAAFAGAIFLFLGVFGGALLVWNTVNHVRLMPYFAEGVGNINTFTAGKAMARHLSHLDAIAGELKVRCVSDFGFNDDMCGERLVWHSASDGLRTVSTLLSHLEDQAGVPAELIEDLRKWQVALEKANEASISFCILLRHGDATNAQEWEIRKGTAF